MPKSSLLLLLLFVVGFLQVSGAENIVTGADQPEKYLPLMKEKRLGLVVNHTSMKGTMHLADFLISEKIDVQKIFAPEHGFRGDASAGEEIQDGVDVKTGVQVVSLYGINRKPTSEHLKNLDLVVFDIQDVGCRFYTYISTLHLVMEACAENNVPLLVLDRPNPNGDYVAGPILLPEFKSFVGMDPIPIVHGCTVGELALMINGEMWTDTVPCVLKVIPVLNYTHRTKYELPVPPSPNLPNYLSVRLYPSLCFFEATTVSVGRGTDYPFQVLGGLQKNLGGFHFTPVDKPGAAINPVNVNQKCYGIDLRELTEVPQFTLQFFLDFYEKYEVEKDFINREKWFNTLAGTGVLLSQIREGKSEAEIMQLFVPETDKYKEIRKKYLLYPDFE
ncbi:MAG: exo-beta-N-acetylmuramidase NamZ domain-containing protein [Draconibacterium sp.]